MNNYYFASTYGSGGYNSSTYNGGATTTSATTDANPGGDAAGLLANTGFDVLIAVTLAFLIIFAALVVRLSRRSRKPAPIKLQSDDTTPTPQL